MKRLVLVLIICTLFGCATALKSPPTVSAVTEDFSGQPAECANIGTENKRTPDDALNCARAMQAAYQGAANQLAQESKRSGVALVTLGTGAAITAAFNGDGSATRAIGSLAALITGNRTYLAPDKLSATYTRAAGRMGCVLSSGAGLLAANAVHLDSMQKMKGVYDGIENAKDANGVKIELDPRLLHLNDRAYAMCASSDAGKRLGGKQAYNPAGNPLESYATFAQIYDVITKVDAATQVSVLAASGELADPRGAATETLGKYFKQEAQNEAMKRVAADTKALADEKKTVAPATVPSKTEAAKANELAAAAEQAADTQKEADRAAALLAACAPSE